MKRTLIALALCAALPVAAVAGELDYSYIEGGYNNINDHGGPDADGFGVQGSYEFGSSGFFLYGGYSSNEIDVFEVDVDLTRFGFGYHHGLSDRHDLVLNANYVEADVDFVGAEFDGYEAEIGVRSAWHPNFETLVALGHGDGGDLGSDSYLKLGAQYKINDRWGLVASASLREDSNEYFFGPRLSF